MSNVIQFPSKVTQDWQLFKVSLMAVLEPLNESNAFKSQIVARMEEVFKDYDFSVEIELALPNEFLEPLQNEIERINSQLQKRSHTLIISRLMLEIELARSQHHG